MSHELTKLPYSYDALKPHIDAKTMEIHHTKHHQGYVTKLNDAIKGTDLESKSLEVIMGSVSEHSTAVRNNVGGPYDHDLFSKFLAPNAVGTPSCELADVFHKDFGCFDEFKYKISAAY